MSDSALPTVAVVLPSQAGFGPRRAGAIGLTVRDHARATPAYHTLVLGGRQSGPVFPNIAFHSVPAPFFVPWPAWARHAIGVFRALRHARPALIEVHDEPRIALWLQRRFPAIPVVLFLYDNPFGGRLPNTLKQRRRLLYGLARIVTVSAWLRDRIMERIETPVRTPIVVPPCIDLATLPLSGSDAGSAGRPISQRRARLVLFAGRLVPEKGADLFVSACTSVLPRLPGWRAEIIGAAENKVKSPETPFTRLLHATADPAGIALLGYRDHPDVMIAMSRAGIVVIPAHVPEPSGRVALEAMANGAAVICPNEGGLPEITGDAALYASSAELGAAIRALIEDPKRLSALAQAGLERAALFDSRKIGQWLETVRGRIIAAGGPRQGSPR